jgi:hypothetical protein
MANQSPSRKPPPAKKKKTTRTKTQVKKKASNQQALAEFEDLIQHEQLEILALTDLRDEKRAEVKKYLYFFFFPQLVLEPCSYRALF